jgi:hypothetical protein
LAAQQEVGLFSRRRLKRRDGNCSSVVRDWPFTSALIGTDFKKTGKGQESNRRVLGKSLGSKAEDIMWMLKGILAGTAIFLAGFALYLAVLMRQKAWHYAKAADRREDIGFDFFTLVRYLILQSPLFYAAFVGALLIGCSLVAF